MPVQRIKLSDQVADQLRAMITAKQYRPGEKLPVESELAAEFGVSRITVREAMHKLDVMEKAGCVMEKAREIRNERSLLFVAATRAKETLTITYTGTKTSMLTPMNEFEQYDKLYTQFQANYPDVEAFEQFYKGGL